MKNKLKILDLFSGIGGFSLGLERTGQFKTVAFCEIDQYCKLLLQKHWKGTKIYDDVKEITQEGFKADGIESPDIITGGFPCQPFSVAGKQKGTSDNRHLWPEMFRIIKAFKPRFVIGENVRGIINIQDGVVFETVCTDLESEGYEVQPFIIPAAGVGAPHRRERIWIIASLENSRRTLQQGTELRKENEDEVERKDAHQHQRSGSPSEFDVADTNTRLGNGQKKEIQTGRNTSNTSSENVADTNFNREKWNQSEDRNGSRTEQGSEDVANTDRTRLQRLGSEHELRNSKEEKQTRRIGWWDVEPDVGRVAHGVSGRVHRLRALGNSIIPQIAEEIGKAIINMERR